MHFSKILFTSLLLGAAATCAAQQNINRAVINQIEEMRWTVTWESCTSINPLNAAVDQNNSACRVYVTDEAGTINYVYFRQQVIFPDYGNYFTVNLEGMNLAEGDYQLVIPEGYVSLYPGGAPNSRQSLEFTIGGAPEISHEMSISPFQGNSFEISWENVTALSPANTTGAYIRDVATGTRYDMVFMDGDDFYSRANIRIVNNTLKVIVTNNYPDLPDGTYEFYLPANFVTFNGGSSGNEAVEGYEFNYVAPWSEGPVTVNGPFEDGTMTLEWVRASAVSYNTDYKGDGWGTVGICIYDGADQQVNVSYPENISFSGNVMTLSLADLGMKGGQCQLVVPEDCLFITVNGETGLTSGIVYRFDYGSSDQPDVPDVPQYPQYDGEASWSIAEGDIVNTEDRPFSVSWQNNPIAFAAGSEDAVSVYGQNVGYMELSTGRDVAISSDKTRLLISLKNLPSDVYRINIPEAFLYITVGNERYVNVASSLENITVTDGTTGINDLSSEQSFSTVFDLRGVVVPVPAEGDLRSLPKGIYIVNGEKIMVR